MDGVVTCSGPTPRPAPVFSRECPELWLSHSQHPYFGPSGVYQSRVSNPGLVARDAPAHCVHLQPCCMGGIWLPSFTQLSDSHLGIRSFAVSNPGKPPFASLALTKLMALSLDPRVTIHIVIVFILPADARNWSLYRELASFTSVGSGSRQPESLARLHILERGHILLATCSSISTGWSRLT